MSDKATILVGQIKSNVVGHDITLIFILDAKLSQHIGTFKRSSV